MRTLIPWQNRLFGSFDGMQDLVGRVFSDGNESGQFLPRMDVVETESHFDVVFDLPGMSADDVDIQVHEGQLTISGSREMERDEEQATYHRLERHQGAFERVLSLPKDVDSESIAAHYHEGVLTVSIPKIEQVLPKTIDIKVTDS